MLERIVRCCTRALPMSAIAVSLLAACGPNTNAPPDIAETSTNNFVGSTECQSCHEAQFDDWRGSHHELAMQVATADTVLGNFSGVEFEHFDVTSILFKDGNRFLARTENAKGDVEDFEVTHTFGVYPLQQYLVEFADGRKQALQIIWDSRALEEGGQRWYHLYPDEPVTAEDPLHWTGPYFNWNYACAECHSTDLDVNYDIATDSFNTSYSEISVGCEACHGPGSRHIEAARGGQLFSDTGLEVDLHDRRNSAWIMNPDTGIAALDRPDTRQQQPESCGRCHARRSTISEHYEYDKPLLDTHMVSLLEQHLYFPDGRILDEVYVYGSFVQSKMYLRGVTCSDCHNPHSGALKTGPDANAVCSQCHLASKFASAEHSRLDPGNCVDCHMPATTYMGVDDRRDHSFRLPNTASDPDHYGATISAARGASGNAALSASLIDLETPAIVRATMLTMLSAPLDEVSSTLLLAQVNDADPLVRIGALRSLRQQAPELRMAAGSHLLRDPVRSVRMEAALTYAEYRDLLPAIDARAYADAASDYRSALLGAASRAESMLNLADFETANGDTAAAERYLRHAMKLAPRSAPVAHSWGLFLVRNGDSEQALVNLRQAADLQPENRRFVYVYGVALNSLGYNEDALKWLGDAFVRFPEDFNIGWALATMLRDDGQNNESLRVARELQGVYPDAANVAALIESQEP
ncbi:MAG: tetratricopeptide repeat protein [Gammaproteobacteria bacterium]|nr:tetratricopeptide repeat protein [Gammaproteobacteria bacterium]